MMVQIPAKNSVIKQVFMANDVVFVVHSLMLASQQGYSAKK